MTYDERHASLRAMLARWTGDYALVNSLFHLGDGNSRYRLDSVKTGLDYALTAIEAELEGYPYYVKDEASAHRGKDEASDPPAPKVPRIVDYRG